MTGHNGQLFEPRSSDPSRWLSSLAWPLPAVVVHVVILAFNAHVWRTMVSSSGRWGAPTVISLGMLHLVILLAAGILYWASSALEWLANWSRGTFSGLRDPTPEERGCASALFRLMLLVVLYVSAWRLWVAALGHAA
jgi:hypothetical protein